uniref:Ovule protein n=1 Tax=Meloidogyne incognita TaxID=6306 RepID=A0A914KLC8_MELIC
MSAYLLTQKFGNSHFQDNNYIKIEFKQLSVGSILVPLNLNRVMDYFYSCIYIFLLYVINYQHPCLLRLL